MLTRFKLYKSSFENVLFLLLIASAPGTALFENDGVCGYENESVNYRIELVHNAKFASPSSALLLFRDGTGNSLTTCRLVSPHFCTPSGRSMYFVEVNVQINTPPDCAVPFHSTPFNIPHQNSDDGDAFIFPPHAGYDPQAFHS